ncbi:acyl-CoA dehydrogenase [Plantactinospora sp. ZYX-F-223]|uniref:acyl-CoA dehydrogenase family protein n=1 Tax=Plantactinospora sp. ZYX-F-223 TaxID=3144103 RepID=UPI0031FBD129
MRIAVGTEEQLLRTLDSALDRPLFAADPPRHADEYARRTYAQLEVVNELVGGASTLLKDSRKMAAVLEWTAVVDPSLFAAAAIHYAVVLTSIRDLGRPDASLVTATDRLDRLDAVGAILITELGQGNNHIALQTQAHYEPETRTFRLHTPHPGARKLMASIALPGVAKIGTVYADLIVAGQSRGTFAFVVPLRERSGLTPGVVVEPLPGTSPVPLDYSIASFEGVRVPYDHWLRDSASISGAGEYLDPLGSADRRMLRSLCLSAWASLAGAVGLAAAARAAVAVALRYANKRTTLGRLSPNRPVLDYQTQRHALYGALSEAYAVTALVRHAVEDFLARPWSVEEAPTDEGAITWSPWVAAHRGNALAKAAAAEICAGVAGECRRRSGAQGVLSANRIIAYEGMAESYNSAGGDNLLILLDAARSMIEGPAPDRPVDRVVGDLTDARERLHLVRHQEATLHLELAEAVRHDAGSPFESWNPHLVDAVALATTHQRRLVAEAFRHAVAAEEPGPARDALAAAELLYGLRDLHEHRAWHLERGTLHATAARTLGGLVDAAVDGVGRHADTLLAGLGLPTRRLNSRMVP